MKLNICVLQYVANSYLVMHFDIYDCIILRKKLIKSKFATFRNRKNMMFYIYKLTWCFIKPITVLDPSLMWYMTWSITSHAYLPKELHGDFIESEGILPKYGQLPPRKCIFTNKCIQCFLNKNMTLWCNPQFDYLSQISIIECIIYCIRTILPDLMGYQRQFRTCWKVTQTPLFKVYRTDCFSHPSRLTGCPVSPTHRCARTFCFFHLSLP